MRNGAIVSEKLMWLFMVFHSACDFVWCGFLSSASHRGGKVFGEKFQKGVFTFCGVLLLFFSVKLLWDGVGMLRQT